MIINDYHDTIDVLKEMYGRQSLGMGGVLILDLDPSLILEDVVYAWQKCCKCGGEALTTLGEEPPEKCLCGHPHFRGCTANLVIQNNRILYNHNRRHCHLEG